MKRISHSTLFSTKIVSNLFLKLTSDDKGTLIKILNKSGKLLITASKLDSKGKEANVISKIKSIRILTVEDKELNKSLNFYKELEADGFFKHNNLEPLMEVTEKDEIVRFFGKSDENGSLSDLLLIVGGDDNTLISIKGIIDLKDIGSITSSLNLDGHKK